MNAWRLVAMLTVFAAMVAAGCGDDDHDGDPAATTAPSYDSTTAPSHDPGCTDEHPIRLSNQGNLAEQFQSCLSEDGTSLRLRNVSSLLLIVKNNGRTKLTTEVHAPEPTTFAEAMVGSVASAYCFHPGGWCRMPPRAVYTAEGPRPINVIVSADPLTTAAATAASAFGGWVDSKLKTRARKYADSIKACAGAVAKLMGEDQVVADAIRTAVDGGTACTGLVQSVHNEAREARPPAAATDDALRLAGRLSGNLRQDLYVFSAIRVVARLR